MVIYDTECPLLGQGITKQHKIRTQTLSVYLVVDVVFMHSQEGQGSR